MKADTIGGPMSSALAVTEAVNEPATGGPPPAPPAFKVLPVPRSEPPTDEELIAAGLDVAPQNARALPLELPHRAAPPRLRRARTAERRGDRAPTSAATVIDAGPPPEVLASPTGVAIRRFLATCVEVMGGFRPTSQLRPFCLPERFDDVAASLTGRSVTAARTRGSSYAGRTGPAGQWPPGPPRAGRVHQTGPGDRVTIRRVQVCEPVDDVAEVAVVLARRDRVWALALRLERHRGRWLCTHLEAV